MEKKIIIIIKILMDKLKKRYEVFSVSEIKKYDA